MNPALLTKEEHGRMLIEHDLELESIGLSMDQVRQVKAILGRRAREATTVGPAVFSDACFKARELKRELKRLNRQKYWLEKKIERLGKPTIPSKFTK